MLSAIDFAVAESMGLTPAIGWSESWKSPATKASAICLNVERNCSATGCSSSSFSNINCFSGTNLNIVSLISAMLSFTARSLWQSCCGNPTLRPTQLTLVRGSSSVSHMARVMNWYNYVGSDPVNFVDPSWLYDTFANVLPEIAWVVR